jgi:hypothetical protein
MTGQQSRSTLPVTEHGSFASGPHTWTGKEHDSLGQGAMRAQQLKDEAGVASPASSGQLVPGDCRG